MSTKESVPDATQLTPDNVAFSKVLETPLGYTVWIREEKSPHKQEGLSVQSPEELTKGIFKLLKITPSVVSYDEGTLRASGEGVNGKIYSLEIPINHDFSAEVEKSPYMDTTAKGKEALEEFTLKLVAQIKAQSTS